MKCYPVINLICKINLYSAKVEITLEAVTDRNDVRLFRVVRLQCYISHYSWGKILFRHLINEYNKYVKYKCKI